MDSTERKVYRKEKLGLTFADNKRDSGFTEVMVHSARLEREPENAEPLEMPDVLKEVFLNFGIAFSQIKKHNL